MEVRGSQRTLPVPPRHSLPLWGSQAYELEDTVHTGTAHDPKPCALGGAGCSKREYLTPRDETKQTGCRLCNAQPIWQGNDSRPREMADQGTETHTDRARSQDVRPRRFGLKPRQPLGMMLGSLLGHCTALPQTAPGASMNTASRCTGCVVASYRIGYEKELCKPDPLH